MKRRFLPALSALSLSMLLAGCGGGTPSTPDAAVMEVVKSFQKDDPSAIWKALPESFQKEINTNLREFVAKVDPEVWKAGAETFDKLADVLRSKKSLLLQMPMLAALDKDPKQAKNFDQVIAMLGTLKDSALMSHSKMKKVDVGDILSSTGSQLMKQIAKMDASTINVPGVKEPLAFKKKISTIGAKMIKQEADTATVEMTVEGEEPTQVQFVRVEGKWIPKGMAEGWKSAMAEMKTDLAAMGTMDAQTKAKFITMATMVKGVLDQMEKAKTKEELEGAIGAMMQNMF